MPEDGENRSFTWPYGQMSPAHIFGLWARRYMYENGLDDADIARALGTIAIQQRQYANNNPGAVFYDRPLTWEDYENARWISKPIRLFDMCLENDGACALVLVDAERARSLEGDPAYVLGVTQSLAAYKEPMGLYGADLMEWFSQAAVDRLYGEAGVSPSDVSVAELYDATSFMTLKSLETYGLVPAGQALEVRDRARHRAGQSAASKYPRRVSVRGLHSRHEHHHRSGPPAARHGAQSGGRCARSLWSAPRSAARSCSGR